MSAKAESIDSYIKEFPKDVREILKKLRAVIKQAAPEAEEVINYGIPTFKLEGNLVHFAGYKNHIGFYPAPSGIKAFQKELSAYKSSKGAVQFPLDKPLPEALIGKMVRYRVRENLEKASMKLISKPGASKKKITKVVKK